MEKGNLNIFVIMPMSDTYYLGESTHNRKYWDDFYEKLEHILEIDRRDEISKLFDVQQLVITRAETPQGNMVDFIIEQLASAHIVIAVLTDQNKNVMYELGIRHCISDKHSLMLIEEGQKIPFDLSNYGVGCYRDSNGQSNVDEKLMERLRLVAAHSERADNPVQDFASRHSDLQLPSTGRIEISLAEVNSQMPDKSPAMFYVESKRDGTPLSLKEQKTSVFMSDIEVLNHSPRALSVLGARLLLSGSEFRSSASERLTWDEIVVGGATTMLHGDFEKGVRIQSEEVLKKRICFEFPFWIPFEHTVIDGVITLTDSFKKEHSSGEISFVRYPA